MMWLGAMILSATVEVTAIDSSAKPISLSEAVALAERNAPEVISAQGQKRTSSAGVRSAYAAFLPNLNLTASATKQYPTRGGTRVENGQIITLPSEPWSHSFGLGANLTL